MDCTLIGKTDILTKYDVHTDGKLQSIIKHYEEKRQYFGKD